MRLRTSAAGATASDDASEAYVLVTGFGPFEEVAVNASGLVAERLSGTHVAGVALRGVVLPTAFAEARARMAALAGTPGCRAVIALGVHGGDGVRLERMARGVVGSARPDVRGEVWLGRELGADVVSALPLEVWAHEVGASVSEDCGGYVCNATYHALLTSGAGRPGVFMHIPRAQEEAALMAVEGRVRVLARLMAS